MPENEKIEVETEDKDSSQEPVDVTPKVETKLSAEDQLAVRIKDDFEKLYGSRLKQTEDRLHGAYRINEKLEKELTEIKKQLSSAKVEPEPKHSDPWSGIENGQSWKQEIEKLASTKAEELLRQKESERQAQDFIKHQQDTMESSKRQVISKYPDLDPETGSPDSLVSKAYVSVLSEHPDWTTNPYGPLLTMYAMEEKLVNENKQNSSTQIKSPKVAIASSTPSRNNINSNSKLVITREQKAFCDRHNIKYEDYLKTASALDETGGIEA